MKKYYKGFTNSKIKNFTLNLCVVILFSNEMREHLGAFMAEMIPIEPDAVRTVEGK